MIITRRAISQQGEELGRIEHRIDEIIADSELPPTSIFTAKSGADVNPAEFTFANSVVDRENLPKRGEGFRKRPLSR